MALEEEMRWPGAAAVGQAQARCGRSGSRGTSRRRRRRRRRPATLPLRAGARWAGRAVEAWPRRPSYDAALVGVRAAEPPTLPTLSRRLTTSRRGEHDARGSEPWAGEAARDPGDQVDGDRRADRPRVGGRARLQQPRGLAPDRRRVGHRTRRAVGPDRVRQELPAAGWEPRPRAAPDALRPGPRLDVLHPRGLAADAPVRGHGRAPARHRRQPDVLALAVHFRRAAGPRAGARRPRGLGSLRAWLRGAARTPAALPRPRPPDNRGRRTFPRHRRRGARRGG